MHISLGINLIIIMELNFVPLMYSLVLYFMLCKLSVENENAGHECTFQFNSTILYVTLSWWKVVINYSSYIKIICVRIFCHVLEFVRLSEMTALKKWPRCLVEINDQVWRGYNKIKMTTFGVENITTLRGHFGWPRTGFVHSWSRMRGNF